MDLGLRGRAAVVTAASKGLGRACAEALAREGADVAICARGEGPLREAEAELGALGVRVVASVLDLTEPGTCERFVAEAAAAFGRLDILVANNGGPPVGAADTVDDETFRRALEANLMVHVRLARAALPHMRARSWGRIVNITSYSVKQPIEGLALSNSSRAGLVGYAKTLSMEVARDGITVNNVAPGPFETDRIRSLAKQRVELEGIAMEDAVAAFGAGVPLGRVGRPEEFAAVVAFLASEPASYVTGTTIQVDGGAVRSLL